jgi:uncharacterized membrane protein YuzA (DUF378 family)
MISETDIDMSKVKDIIVDEGSKTNKGKKILFWLSGLAGLFIIFFFYRRRKKKRENK